MTKLEKIKARLAALLVELTAIKTDKAVLEYDGDDLVAGMNVFVTNEDGERVTAADGEYTTEDGKVITIKNGEAESIVDPVAEVDTEEVTEDETETEKEAEEVAEDVAEDNKEEIETETEETKENEDTEETKETDLDKLTKKIEELEALVNTIVEQLANNKRDTDDRFAKLEKMSAAVSIEEVLQKPQVTSTGDASLDKKLARAKEMGKNWRD